MEKDLGADFGDDNATAESSPQDSNGKEESGRLESNDNHSPKQLDVSTVSPSNNNR